MNRRILAAAPACVLAWSCCAVLSTRSHAQTIVIYSQRLTVDSDGDGNVDLLDNAPGTSNVSQIDTDNDGIGDAIDPTPVNSNPALGDPGLLLGAPSNVPLGSHAFINYLTVLQTPPGGFGHIDLDFGGDSTYDATYFGPLTASLNVIDIPPSLFSGAQWDLNTPGTYTIYMKAFGPAMSSQFDSITNVTVVLPEPASAAAAFALLVTLSSARRRRTRDSGRDRREDRNRT
jgi:hypothetical protein